MSASVKTHTDTHTHDQARGCQQHCQALALLGLEAPTPPGETCVTCNYSNKEQKYTQTL